MIELGLAVLRRWAGSSRGARVWPAAVNQRPIDPGTVRTKGDSREELETTSDSAAREHARSHALPGAGQARYRRGAEDRGGGVRLRLSDGHGLRDLLRVLRRQVLRAIQDLDESVVQR